MEVIKKRCFSSHLRSRRRVACQAGLYISIIYIIEKDINKRIRCLLTGCSSLSTKDLEVRLLDL